MSNGFFGIAPLRATLATLLAMAPLAGAGAAGKLPPAPENLSVTLEKPADPEGDRIAVLNWAPKAADDKLTDKYELFVKGPGEDVFYRIVGRYTITTNSLRVPIFLNSGYYEFQVSALDVDGNESERSNIAKLIAPVPLLRGVNNRFGKLMDGKVHITWTYSRDDVFDLRGFRIYKDGKQVADEKELGRDAAAWTSGPVDPNKLPRFEIQAITEFSGESEKTLVRVKTP